MKKGEIDESALKSAKKKKAAWWAILCLLVAIGIIWAVAYYHGKSEEKKECSAQYSKAEQAVESYEKERAAAINSLQTSSDKASSQYGDLEKALASKADSFPTSCSVGEAKSIKANRAMEETLKNRQKNLSALVANLKVQEERSGLAEERDEIENEIARAKSKLESLPPQTRKEVEKRMAQAQDALSNPASGYAQMKDALLALKGSLA